MLTFADQLSWLIQLAHLPAWKDYAWHRALALDKTWLYAGMSDALFLAMTGRVKATESARQIVTKPRSQSKK